MNKAIQLPESWTDWQLINTQSALDDFLSAINEAPYISVDTEFRRESTYHAELALIQVASDTHIACVDPLAKLDLSALVDLLESDTPKYFHSIFQDAEVLQTSLNCRLQHAIDSQLYAAFGGHPDQISYRAAVEQATGIEIDKSASRSDWMQRPLSAKQMHYAKLDVLYLAQVVEHFKASLSADKIAWALEETERLVTEATTGMTDTQVLQRLKLREPLPDDIANQLAKLQLWRETVAIEKNKPRQWIASDSSLFAIAHLTSQDLPSNELSAEIDAILEADRRADRRQKSAILDCLADDIQIEDNDLIDRVEHDPERHSLLKSLSKYARHIAEKNNLPVSLLGSNKMIKSQMQGQASPLSIQSGWRWPLLGKSIAAILESKLTLNWDDNAQPVLEPN